MYVLQINPPFSVFLVILGLVFGSFIASITWRLPKGITLGGRSICPHCEKEISWLDNIPLLSYLLLGGKCRGCSRKISIRYSIIEGTTGIVFGLFGILGVSSYSLPYLLLIAVFLIAIAVIDFEHQIIPDQLIFLLLTIHFSLLTIFSPSPTLFTNFFWAALSAGFFLILNFMTLGRGMGLGDVKLGFILGLILGQNVWVAIFVSFIIGAVVGLALVGARLAKFGKPIPFGPFLIVGAFLTLFWGGEIASLILPGVR